MNWNLQCVEGMNTHKNAMAWNKIHELFLGLGKLIKFLDFSKAGKHFLYFPAFSQIPAPLGTLRIQICCSI